MKILIVEDEPSLLEIMVHTLRRVQYVVEQAADYASALDKIAGYDYVCILLALMLPDGSGLPPVSYTHLRAHATKAKLVCRLLLEKKKTKKTRSLIQYAHCVARITHRITIRAIQQNERK